MLMATGQHDAQATDKMRVAGKIAAQALEMIAQYVKPGVTSDYLDSLIHDFIIDNNANAACLGYNGYPKTTCISINEVVCHGIPKNKKLKNGDILNIDLVVEKDGYHGDTSKMFIAGEASKVAKRLVRVTQESLYLGIKQVKPGATLGDIGFVIEEHALAHGYTVVEDFCGHGIGTKMHEQPNVLHYGERGEGKILTPGMTFTIEPMLNVGKKDVKVLADNWTAVTKDRQLSAQWEHTILVTDSGYEVLTKRAKETI
ncbi:Methionine aminopeptidase [hydrothermal vent metagenome]|uniref:Methionine aminopeptidase n=1 Tax=hydrothermal vent metagenome TaxID=652676 RepID=A0A3B1A927_9ZZZZ